MLIKNKFTDYLLTAIVSGGIYGAGMTLMNLARYRHLGLEFILNQGLLTGLLFGVLFTVAIYFIQKKALKAAQSRIQQISQSREVICYGAASHKITRITAIGGVLLLSDVALEFYKSNTQPGGSNLCIPLKDITTVTYKGNVLTVATTAQSYSFAAYKANTWKHYIMAELHPAPISQPTAPAYEAAPDPQPAQLGSEVHRNATEKERF